jgi:hypothetical protein
VHLWQGVRKGSIGEETGKLMEEKCMIAAQMGWEPEAGWEIKCHVDHVNVLRTSRYHERLGAWA